MSRRCLGNTSSENPEPRHELHGQDDYVDRVSPHQSLTQIELEAAAVALVNEATQQGYLQPG